MVESTTASRGSREFGLGAACADWLELWRTQRLRVLATLGGITWGTLAVVLLVAFAQSVERTMVEDAAGMGGSIAIVWPSRTTQSWRGLPEGRPVRITADDVRAVAARVPAIELASPEFIAFDTVARGERIYRVSISGVDPDYRELRNMIPQRGGRFLNTSDVGERRRVVFLGDRLATNLFGREDPHGRSVVLRGAPFRVVGVLEPKDQTSDYEGLDRDRACIPASTHAAVFGRRWVTDFVFRAQEPELQDAALDGIYATLGQRLGFAATDRDALLTWDTTEEERMRDWIFFGFRLLLATSGAFTLLVGGVGVANLMFVLVRQRRHELGLLAALGARPSWIRRTIVLQAVLTVAIGGAVGFLVSASVTAVARAIPPLTEAVGEPRISAGVAVATIGLLGAVALLAGWLPARAASRMDPVEALAG